MSRAHAGRAEHLLVEVWQAAEVLRGEPRLEGSHPVAWNRDVERAARGEEPSCGAPGAEVVAELSLGDELDEAGGQRGQEAVGARELVGIVGRRESSRRVQVELSMVVRV